MGPMVAPLMEVVAGDDGGANWVVVVMVTVMVVANGVTRGVGVAWTIPKPRRATRHPRACITPTFSRTQLRSKRPS